MRDSQLDRIRGLPPDKRRLLERLIAEQSKAADRPSASTGIVRRDPDAPVVLSSAQRRMWFVAQHDPAAAQANVPLALRLRGPLDVPALERSLDRILHRHEVLHSAYPERNGRIEVQVVPDAQLALEHVDLRAFGSAEEVLLKAEQHAEREATHPVAHDIAPLVRGTLLRVDEEDHVLLLVFHHLVFDGASVGVLCEELTALYPEEAGGDAADLPELPLQYADYAAWEQMMIESPARRGLLGYWNETLDGAPHETVFAGGSRGRASNAAHVPFHLDAVLYGELDEFCRKHQVTPFVVMVAILAALLERYCDSDDVVIGVQSSLRNRSGLDGLIGLLANPLALRTRLDGRPGLHELAGRVRAAFAGALDHQVPFDALVQETGVRRADGRSPLFNVMFSLTEQSMDSWTIGALQVELLPGGGTKPPPQFDLMLMLVDTGTFIGGAIEFDPISMAEISIAELRESYLHLLAASLRDPDRALREIPLRDGGVAGERQRAAGPALEPATTTVHGVFEETCDRLPDNVAVRAGATMLTYAELESQANRLARRLRTRGVTAERVVGVYLDRSPELVATILAVLKAGGAVLPLDPQHGGDRWKRIFRLARAHLVVARQPQLTDLQEAEIAGVDVSELLSGTEDEPRDRLNLPIHPDQLAYVIYTSGSTGEPKGILGHHRGLVNLAAAQRHEFDLCEADRVLQFSSLSFDAFLWELAMAWGSGAALVTVPWERLLPGASFAEMLRDNGVTALTIPPSILAEVPHDAKLPDLRLLAVAGEACPANLTRRWAADRAMCNAYGPTETTIWASVARCTAGEAPPIGRAIGNLRLHVLDDSLHPVPAGVSGEICVGGAGVTRGYLDRPDLTADRFVPDPFTTEPGSRLYRTGDIGRVLPDGSVRYERRRDVQVKIRGFRVEPEETRTVLAAHRRLQQVHVGVASRQEDQPRLVAWYVTAPKGNGSSTAEVEQELRSIARDRLPAHLRPTAYVSLEHMPRTPHGKVDRAQLPDPDWRMPVPTEPRGSAPEGAVEDALALVWRDVLAIERVGRRDSFFELGGDSVMAILMVSRARQAGVDLSTTDVFRHPTLADLAKVAGTTEAADRLPDSERDTRFPLSPLQEGLLYHSLRDPAAGLYVTQLNVVLRGALDGRALRAAWQALTDRHDALRMRVDWRGVTTAHCVVEPTIDLPFTVTDWSSLSAVDADARWRDLQGRDVADGFDLERAPLHRCTLIEVDHDCHFFTWTAHHIILDGWSHVVVVQELLHLYRHLVADTSPDLPPVPGFGAYVAWLGEQRADRADAYWRAALAGFDEPLRLTAEASSADSSTPGAKDVAQLSVEFADEPLTEYARARGLTLNTLVQAAIALTLAHYAGRTDVLYGATVSGRPSAIPHVEWIVGPFINTLPVRIRIPWDRRVERWFVEVQGQLQEMRQFEHVSLAELQRFSDVSPGDALFELLVAFQNYPPGTESEPNGIDVEAEPMVERTGYPLTLLVEPGKPFRMRWIYAENRISRSAVRRLAAGVRRVLLGLPAAAAGTVRDWPVLERTTLDTFESWNDTGHRFDTAPQLHAAFEAHAAACPNDVALIFDGTPVTYGDLDARANRIANGLAERGIGPERIVAVLGERSLELVAALIGILKAGGAYLPLDPEHPRARLEAILGASRPDCLLVGSGLMGLVSPRWSPITHDLSESWAHYSESRPQDPVANHMVGKYLAYVIHTSGSTGAPKGVMISHEAIVNRIAWCQREYTIAPGDRVMHKTPLVFDPSVWEVFWPLSTGATVVVARPKGHRDSRYIAELARCESVDVLHFVPSMLQAFLEDRRNAGGLESVRLVICSGEALTDSHCCAFHAATDAELVNLYGPTEAAIDVTEWRCRREDHGALVPIGRPIANVIARVLGPGGTPCPIGVAGELCLGGTCLARGYLGRPDLTAKAFVPDPLGAEPGARLYRTGDLARYRPDGAIEFLGRIDSQVKVRGQRIELLEIEEVLREHPGVRDAVVVARRAATGDVGLVAYVVGDEEASASVRAALAERLPAAMVPERFVSVDSLPHTTSGKIDRRALVDADGSSSDGSSGEPAAPALDGLEIEIAEVWSEVLGVGRIGRGQHFFLDLGGHSLLALRLLGRAAARWPEVPDLPTFLADPTIEGMAAAIRAAAPPTAGPVRMNSRGSRRPLFMVHPGLGSALCFVELARSLGADQPLVAFQAPGLEGETPAEDDLVALAQRHVAALRAEGSSAPYRLAGYSFGGLVAFEMARQLQETGAEIEQLIVLDTLAPASGGDSRVLVDDARLLAEIATTLERYAGVAPSVQSRDLKRLTPNEQLRWVQQRLVKRGVLEDGADVLRLDRMLAVSRAAVVARAHYRPERYRGALALVRCQDPTDDEVEGVEPELLDDPALGWSSLCSSVSVSRVPGGHISLMRQPAVGYIADLIANMLRDTGAGATSAAG